MGEWLKIEEMVVNRQQELSDLAEQQRLAKSAGARHRTEPSNHHRKPAPRRGRLARFLYSLLHSRTRAFSR